MENEKYTHKKGIVYLNQYHIVFCPKYRRKVLVGDIERDLKKFLKKLPKNMMYKSKQWKLCLIMFICSFLLTLVNICTKLYKRLKGKAVEY